MLAARALDKSGVRGDSLPALVPAGGEVRRVDAAGHLVVFAAGGVKRQASRRASNKRQVLRATANGLPLACSQQQGVKRSCSQHADRPTATRQRKVDDRLRRSVGVHPHHRRAVHERPPHLPTSPPRHSSAASQRVPPNPSLRRPHLGRTRLAAMRAHPRRLASLLLLLPLPHRHQPLVGPPQRRRLFTQRAL